MGESKRSPEIEDLLQNALAYEKLRPRLAVEDSRAAIEKMIERQYGEGFDAGVRDSRGIPDDERAQARQAGYDEGFDAGEKSGYENAEAAKEDELADRFSKGVRAGEATGFFNGRTEGVKEGKAISISEYGDTDFAKAMRAQRGELEKKLDPSSTGWALGLLGRVTRSFVLEPATDPVLLSDIRQFIERKG